MSALKNKTAYGYKLKRMNNITYQLRRKVIDIIYDLKKTYNLPRIEIRIISEGEKQVCGYAYLGKNIIHINEKYVNHKFLKFIVLHEIVHAITGFRHDEKCYLMNPYIPKIMCETLMYERFDYYLKAYRK